MHGPSFPTVHQAGQTQGRLLSKVERSSNYSFVTRSLAFQSIEDQMTNNATLCSTRAREQIKLLWLGSNIKLIDFKQNQSRANNVNKCRDRTLSIYLQACWHKFVWIPFFAAAAAAAHEMMEGQAEFLIIIVIRAMCQAQAPKPKMLKLVPRSHLAQSFRRQLSLWRKKVSWCINVKSLALRRRRQIIIETVNFSHMCEQHKSTLLFHMCEKNAKLQSAFSTFSRKTDNSVWSAI